jgi:hypothetical protein
MTPKEKINAALKVALQYGSTEGGHHKAWVIDQMCRALLDEHEYDGFVALAKDGKDGPDTYEWDEGIAP